MPSPSPAALRRYTRIDWKTAAQLLGRGAAPEAAAAAVGIDEERLWKHWRRSQRFRFWVKRIMDERQGFAALRLKPAAAEAALERVASPQGLQADAAMLTLLTQGALHEAEPPAEKLTRYHARLRRSKRAAEAEALKAARQRIVAMLAARAAQRGTPAGQAEPATPMPQPQPQPEPPPEPEPKIELKPEPKPEPVPQHAASDGAKRDGTAPNGSEWDEMVRNGTQRDETAQHGVTANTEPPPGPTPGPPPEPLPEPPFMHRSVDDEFPPWVPRPSRYRSIKDLPPRPEEEEAEELRAFFAAAERSAKLATEPGGPG